MLEIVAKANWLEAAKILECQATSRDIKNTLLTIFPQISYGLKNADDLIKELALGESSLGRNKNGEVIRIINLSHVTIRNGDRVLVESYQEYQQQQRVIKLNRGIIGVAEKIKYPETPEAAALRGMKEELGVKPLTLRFLVKTFEKSLHSKYMGIGSFTKAYNFIATLNYNDTKMEYIEERDGFKTVFHWVPLASASLNLRTATSTIQQPGQAKQSK